MNARRSVAPADRRPGRRGEIPALDGIRAVAVALVLADHGGIPGVTGGFLGVDVFFVLSGFLITSLLLDEHAGTGRIGLRDFWIRRARRLLPALLVMVLAVVAVRGLFAAESIATLRDDAVASFFWMANWMFVAQHTDYFAQGAPPSPLQHTWSLGVEEQYYVLWPLLLIALAAVFCRRNRHRLRWVVLGAASAGAIASAAAAIVFTDGATLNRIYFGTDTRAQALLVGAAAAALLVHDWTTVTLGGPVIRTRWLRWVARMLSVVGVAVLGYAAHTGTGSVADFRGGLLIVVAVAAALVIGAVALDQEGPVARVLAWRPLVFLGAISYGVYLWHWPIFLAVNGERTGWSGWSLFAVRCAATLAVALLSWWLLEQPIRRWRPVIVPMLPLAGATAATAAVVTMTVLPVGVPHEPVQESRIDSAALVAPEVPVEVRRPTARDPGTRSVAVFGDSVAWTLMRYLPPTPGLSFSNYTTIGCGIARGGPYRYVGQTLNQKPECDTWPMRWSQRISHDRPDVALLIVGRWEVVDRMNESRWTHIGKPAYDAYLRGELNRALDILSSTGARVVITTEPYNRRAEKPDGSLYPEDNPDRTDDWNALLRSVVKYRQNVTVLDLNRKLGPNGGYTNRIDGIKVRADGVHPTPEAVEWLTPWLVDALR
ncbi:Peptidoglycan/LPS O-acetylase OafA/YrhL, contains acyltransferase and SGNH-hydrolase domains [Mycolicibacterium rutilum]|uniref:Peptidoglycan/LPS O-acetylase OafA/YrhL, contains acyltransferase and SGNH-hydrolase domains n=1 Tax=Mycolicibacterium rutilum TaxID=370526 RepID=A0A1H6JXS2_MYCRU|nr:acyltransferase family protein [Mycolicibacterium rutilum]SEH65436.1 Peptidoglycan/LPS O-acetylase OafA/YrhL, contains acyltransferase and SGNH-hydrolase domains [Mycolicibacterium rutilum]